MPRKTSGFSDAASMNDAAPPHCAVDGGDQPPASPYCALSEGNAPPAALYLVIVADAPQPKAKHPAVDRRWQCGLCQNSNKARRGACKRCGEDRGPQHRHLLNCSADASWSVIVGDDQLQSRAEAPWCSIAYVAAPCIIFVTIVVLAVHFIGQSNPQ
jgi:hypothetical protein